MGLRPSVAAVAVLSAVPLWTTPAVPTQDGPSHVYNAWVIVNLGDPVLGLGRHFQLVPWTPNWGGVGPLVPLVAIFPPLLAEKLYLSGLVVALVLGAACLVGECGGDALLASAVAGILAHGLLFAMGFTGYLVTLAAGLFLAAGAAELLSAHEGAPSTARLRWATVAFAALFMMHMAGALVAAALWLLVVAAPALLAGRIPRVALRRSSPVLVLLPLVALQASKSPPVSYRADPRGPWDRLVELATGGHWQAYAEEDRVVGLALTALVVALLLLRVRLRLRAPVQARALALGGCGALVGYLFLPWSSGGGALVPERLVPLVILLPLAWSTSGAGPARRHSRQAALALLCVALLHRGIQYREWGEVSMKLAHGQPRFEPGALLVAAHQVQGGDGVANPLLHVWGRIAVDARAVALDDYEAALRGLFPVTFRQDTFALAMRSRSDIGRRPGPGVQVFGWAWSPPSRPRP